MQPYGYENTYRVDFPNSTKHRKLSSKVRRGWRLVYRHRRRAVDKTALRRLIKSL